MARSSKQSSQKTKAIHQPALQKALRDFLAVLGYNLDDIISPASKALSGAETRSSRSSAASSGRGNSTPPKSSRSGNSLKSGNPPKSPARSSKSGSTSKSGSSPESPGKRRDGVKEGRIIKKWPFKAPRLASKGLSNLGKGNFCYRISLFQALLHLPALAHYIYYIHDFAVFRNGESPCGGYPDQCVTCAISDLWIYYWWTEDYTRHKSEADCLRQSIKHINSALLRSVPDGHDLADDFKLQRMSDPHDLLAYILGQLEQHELEVQQENADTPTGTELFGLWMDSLWECEDCGDKNFTQCVEPQRGLEITLEIHQRTTRPPSLVQYLRKEFSEDLEIRCEGGCQTTKTDEPKIRKRQRVITRAPPVLKIMFKRFAQEGFTFKKNRIDVKFE
ncbi:hypothetical protein KC327_g15047 [Hortaea werneckii]|nr:hypothetical protein KC358_g15052 [Hortaea werneckii]KAI6808270.1 hypothetical protein KC350_g13401 [Hortaea werneckii]KAI6905198.1 hypothetical protein KC348_g15040 [Hortaea werneckii]KAI6923257.1 hypothetical protein KC341_g14850 [Hortaea werneckii]KAI6956710.1 hypothetical protein KC321_g15012 [Hortaea werneckii]